MKQAGIPRASTMAAIFIIAAYTLLSLFRLGYDYAPSTAWSSNEKGTAVILDLGQEQAIGSLSWYLGNYENRRLELYLGTGTPTVWTRFPDLEMKRVWQWGSRSLNGQGQLIKLVTANQYTEILELVIKDPQGNKLIPVNGSAYPQLFDEAFMDPGWGSIQSGTVFDESFFARTAYEYLHGRRSYEDTHPPLGKLMICPGIALFGMNPFGWRIMGVAAGTLLLAVIWAFAGKLIQNAWLQTGVVALMAADFLHFTESRLGQIDSFLVLFMTLMVYFMYCYREAAGEGRRGWRYLAASGLFFGLAVSCKWSGFYGGAGLAVMWAAVQIRSLKEGRVSGKDVWKTCGVSVLCFILLPAAIYLLSYVPYVPSEEGVGFLKGVLANQKNMFLYHSTLSGSHDSASWWFQWPFTIKPVRLYSMKFQDGTAEILALMGNPAVWWTGMAVLFFCLYQGAKGTSGNKAFLLLAYAAPLLPWIFISRYTFLYHYYPSLPSLVLLTGVWAEEKGKLGQTMLGACAAVAAILFFLFYPVISGKRADQNYIIQWLQWLPTWKFLP